MHVLGFIHEHSRPDRDEHIDVKWDRLWRTNIDNFFKSRELRAGGQEPLPEERYCRNVSTAAIEDPADFADCYNDYEVERPYTPYDYYSIMHYEEDA